MAIVPVAKVIYICEEVDSEYGKTNLYGLFNAIRPAVFPHTQDSFCVFAQLAGGLGDVPIHFDIRRAADGWLVHTTAVHTLHFARRSQVMQIAITISDLVFETPGVYLVELFCDNVWVGDVTLELAGNQP